jgi:hypothetical protein
MDDSFFRIRNIALVSAMAQKYRKRLVRCLGHIVSPPGKSGTGQLEPPEFCYQLSNLLQIKRASGACLLAAPHAEPAVAPGASEALASYFPAIAESANRYDYDM